jgi:hypothetical protein
MIAASVMIHTAKLHWSHLYNTNDFDLVKLKIAEYMALYYKGVPYTIHLTRSNGETYREELEPLSIYSYN